MRTGMISLAMILALAVPATAGEMSLGPIAPAAPVKGQNQFSPDVAYGPSAGSGQGKDQYLVVWQRSRNETGRIECARLDAAGKPLDAKPLVLAPDAEWQEVPRVAFGGNVYLVVWYDIRPSAGSGQAAGKEFDVFAARVTPEGKVLDSGGIPVSRTPADSSRWPAVAFDGKDFIVVWSQLEAGNKGNFKLTAARVGQDGKASPPQPLEVKYLKIPFQKNLQDLGESELAVCGNRLFVATGIWDFAQVFNLPDLKPVGPPEGWRPPGQRAGGSRINMRRPTATTNGKEFLFSVWAGTGGPNLGLLNRVSPECKVDEFPQFWCGGKLGLMAPALAFDGENYLLVRHRWSEEKKDGYGVNSHLCARRVTPDGKPVGAADLDVAGTSASQLNTMPRLASDGKGHVLMVWEQHPTSPDGNVVAATRMITTK